MRSRLTEADLAVADRLLAATDARLERAYPGDDGSRQPVHTVYVPAGRFDQALPARWGAEAVAAAEAAGGIASIAVSCGIDARLAQRVLRKLEKEPVEDLRVDFEDGYGTPEDEVEDADAVRVGREMGRAAATGSGTPSFGIRFKSLERATRSRGLRTLDLFLSALLEEGPLPAGLVLTLPKVTAAEQVEALVGVFDALERAHGLAAGSLRFEVQVETPQVVLDAEGTSPLGRLHGAARGRLSGLHYGTYDYSASLGIAAAHQSMEHPAADFAKQAMLLAAAGTGVRVSDGSTNVLPLGERADEAWRLHARLVSRSLRQGVYQGWDLHANQLITRYLATYAFFREGYPEAARRIRAYLGTEAGTVLDEPATARALAWFVLRGVQCGAIGADEILADTSLDEPGLAALAHPRLPRTRREEE